MDGDLAEVSAKIAPGAVAGASQPLGDHGCPVCAQPLTPEALAEELEIERCGAWVARATLERLQRASDDEAPMSRDPLLTRLLDAIGRFVLSG